MATVVASRPQTAVASRSFTRFAWGVLGWIVIVILWGAYVRASDSGAGCGGHWPLCNGEVLPHSPGLKTIIEFTHRVSSAITAIPVLALAFWGFALFPRGHLVRRGSVWLVVLLVVEAALGAGLVLLGYTDKNASPGRAYYLSLHLLNTQLLLAALTLTAWFSRDSGPPVGRRPRMVLGTLPAALMVGATGVIAALGDTLFPAASLAAGLQQDLSAASSFLLRLRIAHPVLAVAAGVYFITVAILVMRSKPAPLAARLAMMALVVSLAQLCAGAVNLALLAPIPMQLVHLLLADLVWITLVLLAVETPG